jgi:DNA-binding Lrp family transcriptional regulator
MEKNSTETAKNSFLKNPYSPFDNMDYKIIQELRQNARASASAIGRAVGANERTVRKRIDRLLEMGVGHLTMVLEPKIFGYGISVDIFLEIDPNREEDISTQLLQKPQISYLAYGHSTNAMSIEARFKTNEELHEFLRYTLPQINGVKVSRYALVPRILRNIDEWVPPPEAFGIQV